MSGKPGAQRHEDGNEADPDKDHGDDRGDAAVRLRLALLQRVLADPPVVHSMSAADMACERATGVWATDESCYRWLAGRVEPGSRTLETGAGISTVLLAGWGASHRCITPNRHEVDAIMAYCRAREVATGTLTFDVALSEESLCGPDADRSPLDLVFIDGCHGFPVPIIDWYFAGARLRKGGVVVLDDVRLPAVALLRDFLDRDPRWIAVAGTDKWAAFVRQHEGSLNEEFLSQPFLRTPSPTRPPLVRRAVGAVRRRLGGATGHGRHPVDSEETHRTRGGIWARLAP